jgi:hypothetical protein
MDKLAELKALLDKYNATIACDVDGDTHDLSYEMTVDFGSADNWKSHKLSDSNGIDSHDIKI